MIPADPAAPVAARLTDEVLRHAARASIEYGLDALRAVLVEALAARPPDASEVEGALGDAIKLMQSEAHRWRVSDPKTSEHWEATARKLQATQLVIGSLREELEAARPEGPTPPPVSLLKDAPLTDVERNCHEPDYGFDPAPAPTWAKPVPIGEGTAWQCNSCYASAWRPEEIIHYGSCPHAKPAPEPAPTPGPPFTEAQLRDASKRSYVAMQDDFGAMLTYAAQLAREKEQEAAKMQRWNRDALDLIDRICGKVGEEPPRG